MMIAEDKGNESNKCDDVSSCMKSFHDADFGGKK